MGFWCFVLIGTAPECGKSPESPPPARFEFFQVEMAVPIKMVLYAGDEATGDKAAEAAFARVEQLNKILSDYDSGSELRRLCDTSSEGVSVPVSEELWQVLSHAQALSGRTGGAFDVTVGHVVRLWRRARRREVLPPPDRLDAARGLVGYRLLRLHEDRRAVELLKPEMRLDLGGIAKGYAVDEALAVLRKHGITRALVDAGGDIGLGDPPPDKPGWLIGVASLEPNSPPSRYLWLSNVAIATSGDTWQYVQIEGKRYSHLVDPRTGVGLTDHSTVTVIAANGLTADGLASAVSVLGPEKGLKLIEDTPGAAAFILRAPEGSPEIYESSRWKEFPAAQPKKVRDRVPAAEQEGASGCCPKGQQAP
jgi:thiamine biosynthesis lipoprotein